MQQELLALLRLIGGGINCQSISRSPGNGSTIVVAAVQQYVDPSYMCDHGIRKRVHEAISLQQYLTAARIYEYLCTIASFLERVYRGLGHGLSAQKPGTLRGASVSKYVLLLSYTRALWCCRSVDRYS